MSQNTAPAAPTTARTTRRFVRPLLLLACTFTLSGCLLFQRSVELNERPVPGSSAAPVPQEPSRIALGVEIPLSTVQEEANRGLPGELREEKKDRVCDSVRMGPSWSPWVERVCADVRYDVRVRSGPVSISRGPSANTLRASVPVRFDGTVGFRGDLADVLSLDRKNFDGSIVVYSDVSVGIGSDWCPALRANTNFTWQEDPRLEVIDGVYVGIDDLIEGPLNNALNGVSSSIAGAVDCPALRSDLEQAWASASFPIGGSDEPVGYVNVKPRSLGLSAFTVDAGAIRLESLLVADVAVEEEPADGTALPLPELARIPAVPSELALNLPVRIGYDTLVREAEAALVGKEFSAESEAGESRVRIREVEVFPSGDRLALGLSFRADLPSRLLDAEGWIYVLGSPTVSDDGTTVSVEDVSFARIVDNDAWNLLSAVFENRIVSELEDALTFDVSPQLEEMRQRVEEGFRDDQGNVPVSVSLADVSISLGPIVPADSFLEATALFRANARIRAGN